MKELALENSLLDGRYEVGRMLGRGSYAEIYLATDTLAGHQSAHRSVVIKALNVFMHDDLDSDLERTLVENFQNEAVALDRVRHPNVINRLGHGSARDRNGVLFHYLVLEYLSGGDLARFARKQDLSRYTALRYLEQVCSGLAHAHKQNVIHRDIKPQNLLLSADHQVVKIADFGVARLSESEGPITRVGTNIYAPPEHSPTLSGITGKLVFSELTPSADVYSLAKTAFVLLTKESPRFFSGRQVAEMPASVRGETWAKDLLDVLRKATDDDPRSRHPDALTFWKELADSMSEFRSAPASSAVTAANAGPRPAYSRGYTPAAPVVPRFDTDRKLRLPDVPVRRRPGVGISLLESADGKPAEQDSPAAASRFRADTRNDAPAGSQAKSSPRAGLLRKIAITAGFLALFALGILATYNYVLSSVRFPSIASFFGHREATALMNINLRSEANTVNPRIGLVPKGSRLKILDSSGHWYRVEVLEYGGPKADPEFADTGWISGKTRSGAPTLAVNDE